MLRGPTTRKGALHLLVAAGQSVHSLTLAFAALCGCATSPALASGREGEQYVPVVLVIVAFVVIAFAASMIAGVVTGVVRAKRSGDSALKGGAFGVLKGLWYFVIVGAVATAVVSFLGFLWIAYAFVVTWLGLGATDLPAAHGRPS